jgi:Flp pilus assembly pilin Flp
VFSNIRKFGLGSEDARESGQALVEYALIVTVIAMLCVGALTSIGGSVSQVFTDLATAIAGA